MITIISKVGKDGKCADGGFILMYMDTKSEKHRDRIFLESEGRDPVEYDSQGTPGKAKNTD